jgi:hypothetical protein
MLEMAVATDLNVIFAKIVVALLVIKFVNLLIRYKMKFLELYLNNVGIRKSAKLLGCSSSLLVRWVRELAGNLRRELSKVSDELPSDSLPEVIEMDEIYTRVKKGLFGSRYGLFLVEGEVRLLRL